VPYITGDDGFDPAILRYRPLPRHAWIRSRADSDRSQGACIVRAGKKILKQLRGQTTDEGRVKELIAQLEAKLDVFDTIMSAQKYLAGD